MAKKSNKNKSSVKKYDTTKINIKDVTSKLNTIDDTNVTEIDLGVISNDDNVDVKEKKNSFDKTQKINLNDESLAKTTKITSRVLKNKNIYTKSEDINIKDDLSFCDLDTTFVDKRFKVKSVSLSTKNNYIGKSNKKSSRFSLIILLIIFIFVLLFCVACVYLCLEYKPKVKIIEDNENDVVEKKIDENYLFIGDDNLFNFDLKKYYKNTNVVNAGEKNCLTSDVLEDMKKYVYDYNPTNVFIYLGVSDIIDGESDTEILNNIKKIVNNIKENKPDCEIFLFSMFPINDSDDDSINKKLLKNINNDAIKSLNSKYQNITEELKIKYIDLYDLLLDDNKLNLKYTNDGLNINNDGFKIISEKLNKYVTE